MSNPNWANKTIWTGDNLYIMRGMNSASVDLIYLDPPFNSKTDYAAPIGSKAAGAAFKDTWTLTDIDVEWINLIEQKHSQLYRILLAAMTKSDKSYLVYMAARLLEMKRLLKSTGSIYLHCDSTMSHYLKLVMDAVFGPKQFQAHITWRRTYAHNDKMFSATSDHILWYGVNQRPIRNSDAVQIAFSEEEKDEKYPHRDHRGQYMRDNLMGPGITAGESGMPWKGCDPTRYGRCWSAPKTGRYAKHLNENLLPGYLEIKGVHDRLDALNDAGFIYWTSTGVPLLKRYIMPGQGRVPGDIWTDIPPLSRKTKERTNFPTQKPLALLNRIIKASSNKGDVVLDPFCGCATTCVAADNLERNWVGIDISAKASELVVDRIERRQGLFRDIVHRTDIPERTDIGRIRRYNSSANRKHLYGEQGGHCAGCGEHFMQQHLEVDHIISRKKGGTDHLENLQLMCSNCNRIKGDRGMAYLQTKLQLAA